MFGKIFTQIFDSSLADNPQTRWVFMDMLVLADQNGVVDMTHEAIARRTNVPIKIVRAAIHELESADPRSRSSDFHGVRLKRLDEHRDWGWVIVNYERYRDIANATMYREVTRNKVRAIRENMAESKITTEGYVYYIASGNDVKIGHSVNPWARLAELKTARPDSEIVGLEPGGKSLEKSRHETFSKLRNAGEWFDYCKELKEFIRSLRSVITKPIVAEYASASVSDSVGVTRGARFEKPDQSEMELYASKLGLPPLEIQKFYDYYESNGWRVGKNPMKSWQAAMRNWKNHLHTYQSNGGSKSEFWKLTKELELVEKELASINNRATTTATGRIIEPRDRPTFEKLRARRGEIKTQLQLK